jgi:hypothetical protein
LEDYISAHSKTGSSFSYTNLSDTSQDFAGAVCSYN